MLFSVLIVVVVMGFVGVLFNFVVCGYFVVEVGECKIEVFVMFNVFY